MHIQKIFEESRIEELHALMRSYPMASLVVMTPDGLDANNLPFEIDATNGGLGTLRCHVGKSNPVWRQSLTASEVLVIFQGPNAYISPRWYVNGQNSGKVLPSWNYAVVHAYGTMKVIDDRAWLLKHLSALAWQSEKDRPVPWTLEEAPADFVKQAASGIVGMEISVTRLLGKKQLSQQRTAADRESVSKALLAERHDISAATADMIRQIDFPE
jgi:transcriptional regulator